MPKQTQLSWVDIQTRAEFAVKKILASGSPTSITLFGIPRGGVYAAMAISQAFSAYRGLRAHLVDTPKEATWWVDDIEDSGATRARYQKQYGDHPFVSLISRTDDRKAGIEDSWYVFPWERMNEENGPEENVRRILQYLGEDVGREGLLETPQRVVRSWEKLFGGYKQDPKDIAKTFTEGACDEIVILKDVEWFSCCEHHMLPFFGKAHIGYLPNKKVIGVSKLARLLEIYTRRLQIQERIGQQVTQAMIEILAPKGCGVLLEAVHMCMTSRGVEKQNSVMVTCSLQGAFKESGVKSEFLRLIGH